jgi:hypothetical protein
LYFGGKTADRELLIRHAEQFDTYQTVVFRMRVI